MQTFTWISLALATLLPSAVLAFENAGSPPRGSGPTTLDKLILVQPDSTGPIGGMCATARGGNVCRSLSDRAADRLDVRNYGAKVDGTTNDASAFAATRSAAKKGQVIAIPPGAVNLAGYSAAGPSDVLWNIEGPAFFADGVTPLTNIGTDLTRSILHGNSEFLSRLDTKPDLAPPFRIDRQINYTGGKEANVMPASLMNCNINGDGTKAPSKNFVWCNQTIMRVYDTGPAAEHVAVNGTAFRFGAPPGTVSGERTSATWAGLFLNQDDTGKYLGTQVGIEVDVVGAKIDTEKRRIIIQGQIANHPDPANPDEVMSVATGVSLGTNSPNSYIGVGYELTTPYNVAVFDASRATPMGNAPGVLLAPRQRIAFDGGANGAYNRSLTWDSGLLTYRSQNGPIWQADDNGAFTVFGPLRAPVVVQIDSVAPSSTSDPSGTLGEIRYSGAYMYRKTTSGWLRFSGSKF